LSLGFLSLVLFSFHFHSHPKYVDICVNLLGRLSDDEETVRLEVEKTFELIWFSEESVAVSKRVISCLFSLFVFSLCCHQCDLLL
jgi:hypothetical protein